MGFFRTLLLGLLVGTLSLAATLEATAQQAPQSAPAAAPKQAPLKSFLPPRGADAKPAEPPGLFTRAYIWITGKQAEINRKLAAAVRQLKDGGGVFAAGLLAALGFTYGVLHAAGPGHGKAVISSYVLANERTVRRGIALSFLAAFIQAMSAIVIVGIVFLIVKATSLQMRAAEAWLETASWGLVALVGAWLLWREVRRLMARRAQGHASAATGTHAHGHHHGPAHHHGHGHHHHHDHAHDGACCDHAHMPSPEQLQGEWSWRQALAIAFAVGIRPCTGAILVLVFALSQGLLWAGVFATFAMAFGTALTVSLLAALAVGSRELAVRMTGGDGRWAGRIQTAAGLGGSVLVLGLGLVFFFGSLNNSGPF